MPSGSQAKLDDFGDGSDHSKERWLYMLTLVYFGAANIAGATLADIFLVIAGLCLTLYFREKETSPVG